MISVIIQIYNFNINSMGIYFHKKIYISLDFLYTGTSRKVKKWIKQFLPSSAYNLAKYMGSSPYCSDSLPSVKLCTQMINLAYLL